MINFADNELKWIEENLKSWTEDYNKKQYMKDTYAEIKVSVDNVLENLEKVNEDQKLNEEMEHILEHIMFGWISVRDWDLNDVEELFGEDNMFVKVYHTVCYSDIEDDE